jgi:thymidylate synthase
VVTDEPEELYFPEPNYLPLDRAFIEEYIPQILEDAPYQEGVKYSYGQRLRSWFGRDQIEDVIQKLVGEIDAASAVMNLWDSGGNFNQRKDGSSDHQHGGSPCLTNIWVRVVDSELSLTATFRSNDMYGAWVANAMGLRALQRHIRDAIVTRSDHNLIMGPLITISQSSHIYDDVWSSVEQLVGKHYQQRVQYDDPVGNFLIEVAGIDICVSQTTPGSGEVVQTFRDRSPLTLLREITAANPAIRPDHAGYLGVELQKAAMQDFNYYQDR